KPVLTDLTAIDGSTSGLRCGNNYSRIDQDLNQSVGGKYIYLCVRYGPSNATSYIRDVRVIGPYTNSTCCDPDGAPVSLACEQPPDVLLPEDLNAGVSGYGYIYLCVSRVTNANSSSPTPLRGLGAFSIKTANVFGANLQNYCPDALGGVPQASTSVENTNMNDPGVAFSIPPLSIYLCKSTYDGSGAAQPAGSTTPPTLHVTATNTPANCSIFCVPATVTAGSTVKTAGTVTVSFTCTDASGKTLTPTVTKQTYSQNGLFNAMSSCTDGWGNTSTATFTFTRSV